jgi:membrane associated rhomboid family serine protease
MSRHHGGYGPSYRYIGGGPGGVGQTVKLILIISTAVFVLQYLGGDAFNRVLIESFGLTPARVVGGFAVWQLGTYIFLHGGFFHILFNMFAFWMFGSQLEQEWAKHEFLKYFLITGIGAGISSVVVDPFSTIPIVGASGAVYGILLAFGMYFPDRQIYLYGIVPVRAKYFVIGIGAIAFLSAMGSGGGGVAHTAHLGGMIFGYLYLKSGRRRGGWRLRDRYEEWRRQRLRRKFDVYYNRRQAERERERKDDPGRWRN